MIHIITTSVQVRKGYNILGAHVTLGPLWLVERLFVTPLAQLSQWETAWWLILKVMTMFSYYMMNPTWSPSIAKCTYWKHSWGCTKSTNSIITTLNKMTWYINLLLPYFNSLYFNKYDNYSNLEPLYNKHRPLLSLLGVTLTYLAWVHMDASKPKHKTGDVGQYGYWLA